MPARLHREPIATGTPARWLVLTHGIYGTGGNWRGIARQLTRRRPDWGGLLVDLRGHGRSADGDPPHDVAACAADLVALVAEVAGAGMAVAALCGHSFGGKVVLAARAAWPDELADRPDLVQTWMLDSTPGARPDRLADPDTTVIHVLELLAGLPARWARRADFVRVVAAALDAPALDAPALAEWLALSLVRDGDGLRLRLDMVTMRALLADYYTRDLWPAVEDPAQPGSLRLVVAARSDTVPAADRVRAAAAPRTTVDVVDAGHWLHVAAPDAIVDLLARGLP